MRLNKICAIMALTVCELTSTIGGATQVSAVENTVTQKIEVVRNPIFFGKLAGDKEDTSYNLAKDKVNGITWNEEKKELTLDGFKGNGSITLDSEENPDNSEEGCNERGRHRKEDTVSVVVKGDNRIERLNADCNINISGGGTLTTKNYEEKERYDEDKISTLCKVNVEGVTLNNAFIEASEISFNKVKVNNKFELHNVGEYLSAVDEGPDIPEYEYADCFSANKISIDNSTMNFKYFRPNKEQMKSMILSTTMYADVFDIKNSKIDFKGGKKAYKYVVPVVMRNYKKSHIEKDNINFKKGMLFIDNKFCYRFTNVGKKKNAVELAEWLPKDKAKKFTINNNVNICGKKYRITSIGEKAVYVASLKRVVIKNKYIKKIGKNAFYNIKKKLIIKVPSAKKKAYKKLLKKASVKKVVVK